MKPSEKVLGMRSKVRKARRRKRIKEPTQAVDAFVKSLITSSPHKYRSERASAFLTSPVRPWVPSQGRDKASKDDSVFDGAHCSMGASFAQGDGLLEAYKAVPALPEAEVTDVNVSSQAVLDTVSHGRVSKCTTSSDCLDAPAVAGRPSLLETIFSPGFHLFKAIGGEGSTSCTSTVEQVECPDDGHDSAETTATDINSADCQETKISMLTPCSAIKASASAPSEAVVSMFRAPSDISLCFSGEHGVSHLSKDDGTIVCGLDNSSAGKMLVADRPLNQASDCSGRKTLIASPAPLLFMQQPKSVDCKFSKSAGGTDEEDDDELEDFDPYLFIKRLPELSDVVSPCRPSLLPRQTRRCPPIALVLDLDETLVHSTLEHCDDVDFTFSVHFNCQEHTVYVRRRPHLQTFLARVAQLFEIIVFTASQSIYAEQLLNKLDPKQKLIQHRVFRDSCIFVEGNYLKDLTILGRDLSKVAIVDNSPQAFGFQVDNGIPIESWFDDHTDDALLLLLPFLETLVGADDVRPLIANRYNLRKKIASATHFPAMQAEKL